MSRTAQQTKNTITLQGSAQIVTEFFGYSINRYTRKRREQKRKRGRGNQRSSHVSLGSLSSIFPFSCVVCVCVVSCVNSILFQRGVYDSDSFTKVQKYGLGMQVTTDSGLADYLKKVLTQLEGRTQHTQRNNNNNEHSQIIATLHAHDNNHDRFFTMCVCVRIQIG